MSLTELPPGTDLSKVGAGIPPPGYTQNLIDPEFRGNVFNAASSTVLGIAILFVCMRIYIRRFVLRNTSWDDLCIVIAILVQSAYTGVIIRSTTTGVGRHMWDVPLTWVPAFIKLSQVAATMIEMSILFTKLSLLFLYFRIFSPNRLVRWGIYLGIGFCIIFYTVIMFLYIFIKNLPDEVRVNYAVAVVNVFTDFYVLCLPLFAVSKLQLRMNKKIGIMGIFLTGLLACGLSIAGCVFRFNFSYSSTGDITWDLIPVFIVNSIEVDVGIMCACMPIFPALFSKSLTATGWWASLRSSFWKSKTTSSSSNNRTGSKSVISSVKPKAADNYVELEEQKVFNKKGIVQKREYAVDYARNGEQDWQTERTTPFNNSQSAESF